MTPAALAAAIIAALTGLESQGVISIGGWAEEDVNAVLGAIGTLVSQLFSGSGNGGLGGQASPPGTDGNPSGGAAPSAPTGSTS